MSFIETWSIVLDIDIDFTVQYFIYVGSCLPMIKIIRKNEQLCMSVITEKYIKIHIYIVCCRYSNKPLFLFNYIQYQQNIPAI